jgi:hypothetical protein
VLGGLLHRGEVGRTVGDVEPEPEERVRVLLDEVLDVVEQYPDTFLGLPPTRGRSPWMLR